jgi:4-amino-4-deoxy-L-arabinose transferase-like glycosyltransferase
MTDLGIGLFYSLSIYTLLRCLQRPSVWHTVIAGITFGLAQVAKFSALVLFPTFVAIALAYFFRRSKEKGVTFKDGKRHCAFLRFWLQYGS